jgi:hypothetical protein
MIDPFRDQTAVKNTINHLMRPDTLFVGIMKPAQKREELNPRIQGVRVAP